MEVGFKILACPELERTFKVVTSVAKDDGRKLVFIVNNEGLWVVSHHRNRPLPMCTTEDAEKSGAGLLLNLDVAEVSGFRRLRLGVPEPPAPTCNQDGGRQVTVDNRRYHKEPCCLEIPIPKQAEAEFAH